MAELNNTPQSHSLTRTLTRKIYGFLASSKLALALLIAILVSCVVGVTIIRGEQAWLLIFTAAWFNVLLVLLVVNITFSFMGRIWGRRLTLVSLGMLLFHMTFVVIFLGIVYNSMFCFHGNMRLSEGETLSNADLGSYDTYNHGRYFDKSKLKGETTLVMMHRDYKVGDENKIVAYEIVVGERGSREHGIIYITKNLNYSGFRYFPDREGYSILVMLHDDSGNAIYGGVIPLQSLLRSNRTYLYTTGTKYAPGSMLFPAPPETPLFYLQAVFHNSPADHRNGEATFSVWPHELHVEQSQAQQVQGHEEGHGIPMELAQPSTIARGRVPMGEMLQVGDYKLSLDEVRYWVAMDVRYDPGYPIILSSLWIGLVGMVITFIGRLRKRSSHLKSSEGPEPESNG